MASQRKSGVFTGPLTFCVFTNDQITQQLPASWHTPHTMLLRSPAVCAASCKAALDVSLAHLHAAHLHQALTNPLCVLMALTWESGSCRSACSLCMRVCVCVFETAHSVLSHMSVKEMSERNKAPGVFLTGPDRIKPVSSCLTVG